MFEQRQKFIAQIAAMLVVSLGLAFTAGCHRDPNVRKQKYLASGKRYEADGKYKEASIQFANAIRLDRNFGPAYFEQGKTYLKLNNPTQAYGYLREAVELEPSNIDARITFGNLALAGGGQLTPEALTQAQAVLALNPNNADAYALLAGVAQRKGDKAEALKDVQHAIELDPKRATFHSALALLEAQNPDSEPDAEQELNKAIALDGKNATPHLLLASLLDRKGDVQGALQQLNAAVGAAPDNLQARAALATIYVRNKDNAKAEQTLLQAVNAMPENQGASALLAEFYNKTGQLDHATSTFQDLNSKYPKSLAIKLTYARILFAKKDFNGATAQVTQLTKMDAGNPDVQTLNALLLIDSGKSDAAFDMLKKTVKDYPNNVQTQLLLARVALTKADLVTADNAYQAASKLPQGRGNLEVESGLAEVAIMHNDPNRLLELADQTLQEHPNFPRAYLWRGMAEATRKEYDKAEADFQALLKADPDNPVGYVELAAIHYVQGHTSDCNALLEKALEKDPNSNIALRTLASYYMVAKQPDKAIARVKAQIAKEPGNADFYVELASLQLQTKDNKDALDNARKAMQLNPVNTLVTNVFTQAEVANGDVDSALATWQNWIKTHPNDAHGMEMLGSLLQAKGDDTQAATYYKKAIDLDPNDAIAANNLAYLMVEDKQNMDVALSLAQTARRILPDRPETADTLAWVYFHKEDYLAARDLLEQALKTSPDDASMRLHLGMTYAMLNDKADAQTQLKKSIALAPNTKTSSAASDQLAKLGQ